MLTAKTPIYLMVQFSYLIAVPFTILAPDTPAGQKNKDSERLGSKLSKTSAAKGSKAGKV